MIKFNRKTFFIIGAILMLVVILSLGLAFHLINNIKESANVISSYQAEIVADDLRVNNATRFARFVKEEKENLLSMAAVFADAAMPLELIGSLENAAFDSGLQIEFLPSVRLSVAEESPLRLEVVVSGDAVEIFSFIEKIENSPYLIEIESATIFLEKSYVAAPLSAARSVKGKFLLKIYAKTKKN